MRLGDAPVVTPALPGFGVDAPAGFTGTRDAYTAWLIAEIEASPGLAGGAAINMSYQYGCTTGVAPGANRFQKSS